MIVVEERSGNVLVYIYDSFYFQINSEHSLKNKVFYFTLST